MYFLVYTELVVRSCLDADASGCEDGSVDYNGVTVKYNGCFCKTDYCNTASVNHSFSLLVMMMVSGLSLLKIL